MSVTKKQILRKSVTSPNSQENDVFEGRVGFYMFNALFKYFALDFVKSAVRDTKSQIVTFKNKDMVLRNSLATSNQLIADANNSESFQSKAIEMQVDSLMDEMYYWIKIARDEMTLQDILALKNIEQRRHAIRHFSYERLLRESKAILIDKSERGNELYLIKREAGIYQVDAYFLKYKCVSTSREYVSPVDPTIFRSLPMDKVLETMNKGLSYKIIYRDSNWGKSNIRFLTSENEMDITVSSDEEITLVRGGLADLAMSWKFGWSLPQYQSLVNVNEG